MKPFLPTKLLARVLALFVFLLVPGIIHAEGWRLVGITGQQANEDPDGEGGFLYPDNTLFEINHFNGALNKLFRTTWVPDSQSIGYCPTNGLVYHTAGAQAYRNNPLQTGHEQGGPDIPGLAYQDNQFMETVNLATRAMNGVLNANPCPNPDPSLPCFGLPAPIPTWVLPAYRRDSTQTDPTNSVRGTNEYTALRGMAWSTNKNLFYVSDNEGIFKLTAGGDSTFLARPAFTNDGGAPDECKAIAFVTVTNVTKLLVGHRDGAGTNGYIMEVDPDTGTNRGEIALSYPPGGADPVGEFGGLLGLAQHPVTGVLYGIRQTSDPFLRELVTINPVTGETTLVGSMGMHVVSIVFVPLDPWRLVGITGQQGNEDPDGQGGFVYPDNTLFEINHFSAVPSKLFRTTWAPDSQSIGYCPTNGLVYHTAGAQAYRNNPLQTGHEQGGPDIPGLAYQDNQFMETVNLATRAMNGVLNANPCPNPDPSLPCFGLPAPIPTWVLPAYRRDSTQTDPTNSVRGTNEYTALRGMAWSTNKNLFYVSDNEGVFKLTAGGDSTFLARPAFTNDGGALDECKAIAFVTVTNVTKLLVGHRDGAGGFGYIMEVDPESGTNRGELALSYPPGGGLPTGEFGGLLGLAQHPVTRVLYGIRQTSDPLERELVTINPVTGATKLVGNMGMHVVSMAFVPTPGPLRIESITRNGNNLTITWSGGLSPYQLQTRSSLSTGSWSNVGGTTTQFSATITNGVSGSTGFFRVFGQ